MEMSIVCSNRISYALKHDFLCFFKRKPLSLRQKRLTLKKPTFWNWFGYVYFKFDLSRFIHRETASNQFWQLRPKKRISGKKRIKSGFLLDIYIFTV